MTNQILMSLKESSLYMIKCCFLIKWLSIMSYMNGLVLRIVAKCMKGKINGPNLSFQIGCQQDFL